MTGLAVVQRDGVFCVVGADGVARPIRLGGQPVRGFLPGWRPRGACGGFPPWTVLDLVHQSGREASWLLTGELEHWSVPLHGLSAAEQALIAEQAAPAIRAAHHSMLCAAAPVLPRGLALFDGLNRQAIADIVAIAADAAIGATRVADLYRQAPDPAGVEARSARGRPIRLRALPEALAGNFQDALQRALHDGALACPSPVDGHMLQSRDSLVLHEHRLAYRFVDARHGLVFFVSTTDYFFSKADLFVPSLNTVFMPHAEDRQLQTLARQFLAHAIADAAPLLAYLGRDKATAGQGFAVVCRGHPHLHMGHQIWNELSALDRLVRRVPLEALPAVIVPNAAQGSEVFAPVDRIFPELEGRVDRGLRSPDTLGEFVYRKGYCLFRALDEHVTLELARRIREAAAEEPPIGDDTRLAARARAESIPCVLFGLRVENRTATDPAATVIACVEHLQARLGRVVVVLDGHNARINHDPVSQYESFGQSQHELPLFAELRLALQLRRHFENSGVEIVNLCGAAVSRSLFWGQRADFFVAFWGAGLAKYRWVCNRPGLVLTNSWNLRNRGDLGIYHAPRYQEGGTPMHFIDAAGIVDMPEAPLLFAPVADPVPVYSNFQIDVGTLLHALDGMIREYLP